MISYMTYFGNTNSDIRVSFYFKKPLCNELGLKKGQKYFVEFDNENSKFNFKLIRSFNDLDNNFIFQTAGGGERGIYIRKGMSYFNDLEFPKVPMTIILENYSVNEEGSFFVKFVWDSELMKNSSPIKKMIFTTKNLNIFNYLDGNRKLNPSKVDGIIRSFQKKKLDFHIVVNEKFEVIDGQNRLEACKTLGLPIDYVVMDGYGIDEVKLYNMTGSNWTYKDIINLYIEKDNSNYRILKSYMDTYKLPVSTLSTLLMNFNLYNRVGKSTIYEGEFYANRIDETREFLGCLSEVRSIYEHAKSRIFIESYQKAYLNKKFDNDIFIKSLKNNFIVLDTCRTGKQYLVAIETIYNYGKRKRISLF